MRAPRETPDITLVGAGLAGSLLAIFLARRGYRVTLLERRPDPRRPTTATAAGRSINLALANRGITALEEVGVMESVRSALIPMAGRMLHDEEGRLRLIPYGNKPHEVIYSVSRAGLNTLLLDVAESTGRVAIRFGCTVCGVDFADRQVRFLAGEDPEQQTQAQATPYDVLLGTDGSASAVRAAILERTGGRLAEEPLGHGYKELSIPAAAGGRFRMERGALHIWPRGEYMLIALPNVDGSFTVTLFLPNQGDESFQALTTTEAVYALFERRFADTIPLMPRLGEEFFENPTGHLETIRCEPWSFEDHALVLGDAAHAIVPFHGQGMNAAFEDCSAFDRCLGDSDRPWNEIFTQFEKRRRPNTDAIADMALENYVEMRSTVREPKFQLKKDLSFRLEERHPGRFIPRYSMVMFHTIPYAEAKRRGAIQEEILEELTSRAASLDEVDLGRADRLVAKRLGEARYEESRGTSRSSRSLRSLGSTLKTQPLCIRNTTQEETMELGNFSVSLAVKDIEASKLFYEKLGFKAFMGDQSQNWLIMKNGDHAIGLFQGMFDKNILTFNPGWNSDAQPLAEFTDVRDLQRRLKASGVDMISEADESSTGPASFMIADPDGNTILVDQHV